MNGKNVAVIVPVFNRATVVVHTLDSIIAQTVLPGKVIVVDDGSSDDTVASVRKWIDRNQGICSLQLVEQINRGPSAARNNGMRHIAGFSLIAFLDSDDLWPADFLGRCLTALGQAPHAVAVSCDRLYVDTDGTTVRRDDLSLIGEDATRWLFVNDGGIASCTLFRSEAIGQFGGFDERLPTGHDSDLFLRVSLMGDWLYAAGEPVRFQCRLSLSRKEQKRVSETYNDCHCRWAHIYEDFIDLRGGRDALTPSVYRDRLARRWYWAGQQMMKNGRLLEARECLRRSLAWRFWRPKAWFRLLRSYLPIAG